MDSRLQLHVPVLSVERDFMVVAEPLDDVEGSEPLRLEANAQPGLPRGEVHGRLKPEPRRQLLEHSSARKEPSPGELQLLPIERQPSLYERLLPVGAELPDAELGVVVGAESELGAQEFVGFADF